MFKTVWIFVFLFVTVAFVASQEFGEDIVIDEDAASPATTVAAGAGGTTEAGGTSDSSPSGDCADEIADCKKTAYECNDTRYKPIMCSLCKIQKGELYFIKLTQKLTYILFVTEYR
uniref:Uncharacterized protein n=1 Tax=Panagrolaimus davidi TaxID=227884 RepID=A0A914PKC6_9BILA